MREKKLKVYCIATQKTFFPMTCETTTTTDGETTVKKKNIRLLKESIISIKRLNLTLPVF